METSEHHPHFKTSGARRGLLSLFGAFTVAAIILVVVVLTARSSLAGSHTTPPLQLLPFVFHSAVEGQGSGTTSSVKLFPEELLSVESYHGGSGTFRITARPSRREIPERVRVISTAGPGQWVTSITLPPQLGPWVFEVIADGCWGMVLLRGAPVAEGRVVPGTHECGGTMPPTATATPVSFLWVAEGEGGGTTTAATLYAGQTIFASVYHTGSGAFEIRMRDPELGFIDFLVEGTGSQQWNTTFVVPLTGPYVFDVFADGCWGIVLDSGSPVTPTPIPPRTYDCNFTPTPTATPVTPTPTATETPTSVPTATQTPAPTATPVSTPVPFLFELNGRGNLLSGPVGLPSGQTIFASGYHTGSGRFQITRQTGAGTHGRVIVSGTGRTEWNTTLTVPFDNNVSWVLDIVADGCWGIVMHSGQPATPTPVPPGIPDCPADTPTPVPPTSTPPTRIRSQPPSTRTPTPAPASTPPVPTLVPPTPTATETLPDPTPWPTPIAPATGSGPLSTQPFSAGGAAYGVTYGDGSCNGGDETYCSSPGAATVGADSCTVASSCVNLGDGATVGNNSCIGVVACQLAGSANGSSTIGNNSCTGWAACLQVGSSDGDSTIGDGSCIEQETSPEFPGCASAGRDSGSSRIGDGSCIGVRPCWGVGQINGNSVIGDGSCDGQEACRDAANLGGNSVVGDGSCTGPGGVCFAVGANDGDSTIGDGSCIEHHGHSESSGCERNGSGGGSSRIGDGSCIGPNPCGKNGTGNGGSSVMGDGSCFGDHACTGVGGAGGSSVIGDGSCKGLGACAVVGASSSSEIGHNSCRGELACTYAGGGEGPIAGTFEDAESSSIGNNSCNGFEACLHPFYPDGYPTSIGDNSCNQSGSFDQFCQAAVAAAGNCRYNDVVSEFCSRPIPIAPTRQPGVPPAPLATAVPTTEPPPTPTEVPPADTPTEPPHEPTAVATPLAPSTGSGPGPSARTLGPPFLLLALLAASGALGALALWQIRRR